MSEKPDGGQAYPQPLTVGPSGGVYPAYPGMTLRDYFAGQALMEWTGTIELRQPDDVVRAQMKVVAAICYGFADAMIEARNK